jgi:hypothetical protein
MAMHNRRGGAFASFQHTRKLAPEPAGEVAAEGRAETNSAALDLTAA